MQANYAQSAIFLLGTALGATIGLILAAILTPKSGPETRQYLKAQSFAFKNKVVQNSDDISQRIQAATDTWISQLRSAADDLVAQGHLSSEEADAQISEVLSRVRG